MTLLIAIAIAAYLAIGFLILVLFYMQFPGYDIAGIAVVLFWPLVLVIGGLYRVDDAAKYVANILRN